VVELEKNPADICLCFEQEYVFDAMGYCWVCNDDDKSLVWWLFWMRSGMEDPNAKTPVQIYS